MSTTEQQAGFDCGAQLAAARSTISEQEKRIAELEAERGNLWRELREVRSCRDVDKAVIATLKDELTSERQRREEAEAALSRYTGTDIPGSGAASDYFAKYEPGK